MRNICEKCRAGQIASLVSFVRGFSSDNLPKSTRRIIKAPKKNIAKSTTFESESSKDVSSKLKKADMPPMVKEATKRKNAQLKHEVEKTSDSATQKVFNQERSAPKAILDECRCNDVNIQMISNSIFEQIFGSEDFSHPPRPNIVESSQKELRRHGIEFTKCPRLPEVTFNLPKLQGSNILEHFYNIGEEQSAPYRELTLGLIANGLPPAPTSWVMKPGWYKYSSHDDPKPVLYPPDDAIIFDVEVCMSAGTEPTIACAVSSTHWYGWVSHSLVDDHRRIKDIPIMDINDLIPLESDSTTSGANLSSEQKRPRIVVGHNVSYDRSKIKEQYFMERTSMRFVDTMSLHVCISGVTSYQRAMLKSKDKKEKEKDDPWMQISSLNSLAEVHKLYCGTEVSKSARDLFVDGSMADIRNSFQDAMAYCSMDVVATASILAKIFPMFLERFPHPVTFAGMLELGTAYLPINSNWMRYLDNADSTYEDSKLETRQLLSVKADRACRLMHNEKYKEDLWMWDQDWSTQTLKLKKLATKSKKYLTDDNYGSFNDNGKNSCLNPSVNSAIEFLAEANRAKQDEQSKNQDISRYIKIDEDFIRKYSNENKATTYSSGDLNTYDELDKKFKHLFDMQSLLPVIRPYLAGYPAWYRKLCLKPKEENWTPGPHSISTSMQVTPKLLSLCWEGFPVHYIRGEGWGFLVPYRQDRPEDWSPGNGPTVPFEQMLEKCPTYEFNESANKVQSSSTLTGLWKDVEKDLGKRDYYSKKKEDKTDGAYTGTGVWCNISIDDCCYFLRLPHKDGASKKVGNPLAKDFLNKFSENVLTGGGEEAAKVLMFARMMSYWRNNRDRIRGQQLVWLPINHLPSSLQGNDKLYGAILPQVVVCGTLTRRAMESTWMTASNAHKERIGSELRGMVQAPPGYRIVGADVDSQELWIASLLGDAGCGMHGGTPLGWAVLAGSKASGTDPHSLTARAINVSRDHAKVINYARVYGAGQNFAERLLKQFNPTMGDGEAKAKARKMFSTTKGKRVYTIKEQYRKNFVNDGVLDENLKTFTGYDARSLASMSGKTLEEMFNSPRWSEGTESAMFNKLEDIAGSPQPVTPFLGCRLSRALEGLGVQFTPTLVNWVVQSGAVDFLHLMLANMRWLGGDNVRFCLSFHDEVRYLVKEKLQYEAALAMHITNLFTRAFCSQMVGLKDLPLSVAFFSSVEVDTALRKDASHDCETPSNPHGLEKGYGVQKGESLDIWQTLQKCNPKMEKLFDCQTQCTIKR